MNTAEQREADRKARNEKVPFDWRIVKVDQTNLCPEWTKKNRVTEAGWFYVYDRNRHVHICSFTPSQELIAVEPYVLVEDGVSDEDQERIETEWRESEEPEVNYMDVSDVSQLPSIPAGHIPEREEDEDSEKYYHRACEEIREWYCGNPPWFTEGMP